MDMADEDLERDDKEPFFFGGSTGAGGRPGQNQQLLDMVEIIISVTRFSSIKYCRISEIAL